MFKYNTSDRAYYLDRFLNDTNERAFKIFDDKNMRYDISKDPIFPLKYSIVFGNVSREFIDNLLFCSPSRIAKILVDNRHESIDYIINLIEKEIDSMEWELVVTTSSPKVIGRFKTKRGAINAFDKIDHWEDAKGNRAEWLVVRIKMSYYGPYRICASKYFSL